MRRFVAVLGGSLAIAAALPMTAAAAPSVTEFSSGFAPGASIQGLTAGPDGNLWATDGANGKIARVSPSGAVTLFDAPASTSSPVGVTAGPDGALWFVTGSPAQVARITTDGTITGTFALSGTSPQSIVTGPDGALWFTESGPGAKIGRLTTDGTLTEYPLPNPGSSPWDIAVGPDGKLWFTEHSNTSKVGNIDPITHVIAEYTVGTAMGNEIVAGPDGNLWMTAGGSAGKVARIAPDGTGYQEWATPTVNATPFGIANGVDGRVYFTESTAGAVARISPSGTIQEFTGAGTSGLSSSSSPRAIVLGPDSNIWFAQGAAGKGIARLSLEPGAKTGSVSDVTDATAKVRASVEPNSQVTTAYFEYGPTAAYGSQTDPVAMGSGSARVTLVALLGSLAPNTTYHYRVVATNPAGTRFGADATFTTAAALVADSSGTDTTTATNDAPPATPPVTEPQTEAGAVPVLGETVVVSAGKGSVLVRLPGKRRFAPIDGADAIPVGSTIDTRRGTVRLTSIRGTGGKRQTASFRGGLFQVRQRHSGMTDLYLRGGDFSACRRARHARRGSMAAAAVRRVYRRRLWGRDRHGRFRTHGSHAIATVRGTEWTVADRCDGTMTRVAHGKVSVRDLGRQRSVLVRAGGSYLARVKR
jgi:virginiamycin B lyase